MKTRTIVTGSMLIAVGAVVGFVLDVPLIPAAPFLKYTPADIPTLLGSFTFGPLIGFLIALLRAVLHGIVTGFRDGPIGLVMDVSMASIMAVTAGLVYKARKDRVGAALGLLAGSVAMTVIACLLSYFGGLPLMGLPASLVWTTTLPFNLLKCVINSAVVFILYKPLAPLMKGSAPTPTVCASETYRLPKDTQEMSVPHR
jgi:riboflavin transporter FmnP